MGGKTTTIANTEQKLGTLRIQTSMYGLAVRLMWGQPRVTGNLLWFGNFQAVAHTTTEEQGGKGGGGVRQVTTTYTYYAAAMMALGRGPIAGIASAWKGKERFSGAEVAGAIRTLTHTATVPAGTPTGGIGSPLGPGGGTISVPLGGDTFKATVSVVIPDYYSYSGAEDYTGPQRALREGIDYTQDGAGNYTFPPGSADGRTVQIRYQVQGAATWYSALGQLGLSLAPGIVGQPVWSWLQNYDANVALGYSGTAYVYAEAYQLTNQAEVENHSFEVVTGLQVGGGVVDAWAHEILRDFLGNPCYGVRWQSSRLASLSAFTDYCKARQLWLSPVMEEQRPARDWMQDIADITNSEWAWQGTVLDLVPRGDAAITSAWGTYTPSITPAFDLVHAEGGDILAPVEIEPVVNEDAKNIIRIQWTNRANGYAIEIMEARDAAHIELYGERPAEVRNMEAIHDPAVAQSVAQQLLQREMTVWNRYKFRTPFSRALVSLMTLVTLTDDDSALDRVPVRITARREAGNLEYEFEAEDAPIGAASAPTYGQQGGAGFAHDYNSRAPSVLPPTIFEAPVERTTTGLEVYAAVTGPAGSNWGGCRVWASFDGVNYKQVARMYGGSRYGALAAAIDADDTSLNLVLAGQGGQINTGSAIDASSLATLCWLFGAQDGGEYIAHEGATLTGANAYTLAGLVRGAFDTTKQAHGAGAAFVRIDDAIARSGPLDLSLIGATMWFKFTSFNVYGGGEQDVSEVEAYDYTITGAMAKLPPANFDYFQLDIQPDGTRQFTFGYVATPRPVDFLGAQIRYIEGNDPNPDWDSMRRFDDLPDNGYYSQSPVETNMLLAGEYTFALRALDQTRNASRVAMLIQATLPDRRKGRTLAEWQEHTEGWTGTKTSCHIDPVNGYIEADDTGTWDTLPSTWDAFTHWSMSPASPIEYTGPVRDLGTNVPTQVDSLVDADGTVVQELRTSEDNATWTAWGSASPPFNARYIQLRLRVSSSALEPVPTIRSWRYSVSADLKREAIENLDVSTLTGSYRIGVGDVRIPIKGTYSVLKSPYVVIQDSSAATWSWVLIDKNVSPGPRVQFRKNGVLADPALVDFEVEGI